MSKPKKEITNAELAEKMEQGFADMGEAFNKLVDKSDVLDTRMGKVEGTLGGVQTHVALLENQMYDLRIEVQSVKREVHDVKREVQGVQREVQGVKREVHDVKRVIKPYDTVHKVFTKDISGLKKRVRVLEGTKR